MRRYCIGAIFLFIACTQSICATEAPVVLVTGGAGYIGSHTCKALKLAGFTPVAYDSLINGTQDAVKWGPLVIGDIHDSKKLDEVFLKYRPVAVMHFAALRNVADSVKDPSSYYHVNAAGTLNLLQAMHRHNVKNIIFSSSCTVYGVSQANLIDEKQPKAPINPYAFSKFVVERFIEDFARSYDFKYMILRYFNASGVDYKSGLKRFKPSSYNFLIPRTLLAVLHEAPALPLLGIDYPTPDGTAIRDYIHVSDLADAHVLSLQYLQNTQKSQTLNLGTGKGYSVREIIYMIEKITGKKVPIEIMPRREGDVPKAVADPSLAKTLLRFSPKYSDLHTIIESEWRAMNMEPAR